MKTVTAVVVLVLIVTLSSWLILSRECTDETQYATVSYTAIDSLLTLLFEKGRHQAYLAISQNSEAHYVQFYKYKDSAEERVYATYYLHNKETEKFTEDVKEFCRSSGLDFEYISYDTLNANLMLDTRHIDDKNPMYLEIKIHDTIAAKKYFDFLAIRSFGFSRDLGFDSELSLCGS